MTTDEFYSFMQVEPILNPKYRPKPIFVPKNEDLEIEAQERLPLDQLVDMTLLFRLSHENDFLRQLKATEHGRRLSKQMELCLETLRHLVEASPDSFQSQLNDLVLTQKARLRPGPDELPGSPLGS